MSSDTIEAIAWSLIHSLWQQGIVAGLLWWWFRRGAVRQPSRRYVVACGALGLAALLPIATFLVLMASPASGAGVGAEYDPSSGAVSIPPEVALQPPSPPIGEIHSPVFVEPPAPLLPEGTARMIAMAWMVGVALFGLRLGGGWVYMQQMRWVGVVAPAAEWRRMVEELAPRLGVFRPVWLYESRQVAVPTLIGWLRPVILLPVGMLTGLTTAQVEAILAHELAHVRRHDYLVNLLQSIADVFYYYSPGVWLISRLIREEREYCCDDLAVAATGNPMALGRALVELEKSRPDRMPQTAVAATGGALFHRVRRLVVAAPSSARPSANMLAPALGLALVVLVLLPMTGLQAGNRGADDLPEPFTPATHATYTKGRTLVTLVAEDITLAEACDRLYRASGLEVDLPPGAGQQRVSLDFQEVSANSAMVAMFNLLEMDHPVDPKSGRVMPKYWPEVGPRPELRRLSLAHFHARQTMFRGLAHEVKWTSAERISLGEGIRRLSEISGITFAFSSPELRELAVQTYLPKGTVRDALHQMLKPHTLNYRYLDDSRILIEP